MPWVTAMEPARKTGVTRHTRSRVTLPPQARKHTANRSIRTASSRKRSGVRSSAQRDHNRMPVRRIEAAPPAFLEYMLLWGLVAAGIAAFIVYLGRKKHSNKNAASGSHLARKKKPRRPRT